MSYKIELRCPTKIEAIDSSDSRMYTLYPTPELASEINDVIEQDGFWSANQMEYVCEYDNSGIRIENVLEDVRFGVEYADGQVWGKAYIQSNRKLTSAEVDYLIDNIAGQFSDGWGESFEQEKIQGNSHDEYYCSFWTSDRDWKLVKV